MSASTVSITANPAARRRPVVPAAEKKTASNIELLAADALPHSKTNADSNTAAAATNGRDLSHHSIRGEAEVRSSRDAVYQVKKTAAASTISPPTTARRARKPAAPPPKPRWQTVLSVFAKNFVLLALLLGLVQIVRRLALRSTGDGGSSFAVSDELEGRIAEVERLVKTTARMIQVQVEVVDRKIDGEVGVLRDEVGKKIEARSGLIEKKLEELEEKSVGLERNLGELKNLNWLSKEEFERMYNELKKMKIGSGDGGEAGLNDIRAYARDVVMREIERHAADGLGRADYALSSGGAVVVKHSDPFSSKKGGNWLPIGIKDGVSNIAQKMLTPSFGEPGHCFPLKGSAGFVQIKLRKAIIPEAVTLEHVAKSVAFDRTSAPKDCRVSGWFQGKNMEPAEERYLLAEFTYDLEKSNAQTFNVLDSAGSSVIDTVRFDFTSNHGHTSHTCIYRLRVHGHESDSVSVMPIQS